MLEELAILAFYARSGGSSTFSAFQKLSGVEHLRSRGSAGHAIFTLELLVVPLRGRHASRQSFFYVASLSPLRHVSGAQRFPFLEQPGHLPRAAFRRGTDRVGQLKFYSVLDPSGVRHLSIGLGSDQAPGPGDRGGLVRHDAQLHAGLHDAELDAL